jgi:hypothetical protein
VPRAARAAKQLVTEVSAHYPDAVAIYEDPDGFNTYRSVRFEPEVADWLEFALSGLNDPRIVGFTRDDNGIVVTLSSSLRLGEQHQAYYLPKRPKVEESAPKKRAPRKKAAAQSDEQSKLS